MKMQLLPRHTILVLTPATTFDYGKTCTLHGLFEGYNIGPNYIIAGDKN